MGVVETVLQIFIWLLLLWPIAWIGKKVTEHQIKNDARWKRRQNYQEMKNKYGRY